jgi:hypothetical protein
MPKRIFFCNKKFNNKIMETKPMLENHVIKPPMSIVDDGNDYRLLPFMNELSLDSKIAELENFMSINDGRFCNEEEKDKLYEDAKNIWRGFVAELKEVVYNIYLNEKQHDFILDLLNNKLEYDVNTVFFALELVNLLGKWSEDGSPVNGLKGYLADATETTYIYHIIAKHKVLGLNQETKLFSEILLRIGEISKIVAYYDTHAKSLSKSIQDWVSSFDENVVQPV